MHRKISIFNYCPVFIYFLSLIFHPHYANSTSTEIVQYCHNNWLIINPDRTTSLAFHAQNSTKLANMLGKEIEEVSGGDGVSWSYIK
jgi:hypothetical protein